MAPSSNIFDFRIFFLPSLVTSPSFMSILPLVLTIFVCKGLNRDPEIGNTHASVLYNIWRLARVWNTKLDKYPYEKLFKDTHRKNTPSDKTLMLSKSMNMNIWMIGATNQLFIRSS